MEKKIITESLIYIEKNITRKLSIEEIADYAGYSRFHFAREFKQEMNISVMEYVKERKIIHASEAILEGDKILDVAIQYGWESHGGFIKAFKSYYAFYEKINEHAPKEVLVKMLKEKMLENRMDISELENAYKFCQKLYGNRKRYSGDEYITHLLHVSLLLLQMGAEAKVVYAGMFCDVFRKTEVTAKELQKKLPKDVAEIIIRLKEYDIEAGGLGDEECAIIKLAERLHNMRTVEYMDEGEIKRRAQETISNFMPVARKLNNERIVGELSNLSVRYLE